MQDYSAYGLRIRSALSLPEMAPGVASDGDSGDVTVRLGPVQPLPMQRDNSGFGFWATQDEACHLLEKVGAFLVRGGREIVIDPAPGVEERLLRLSLLGPALALILHQRGLLVMHASVVARGDHAVAFLGKNGWGKSTIAAALHTKGYDLVTDDVAAVRFDADGPYVFPSFPQMKLWPEAATLLGSALDSLSILHPDFDKRGWRAERGFSSVPRRLERIYALASGPPPRSKRWSHAKRASSSWGTGTVTGSVQVSCRTAPPLVIFSNARRSRIRSPPVAWFDRADHRRCCTWPISSTKICAG